MAPRLCILLALFAAACAPPEYRHDFMNDLSYPVVVRGCDNCRDGLRVEPSTRASLIFRPGATLTVSEIDGTRIGCARASEDGGSTSEVMLTEASFFVGLQCE